MERLMSKKEETPVSAPIDLAKVDKPKYSKEDLLIIFDEIMFEGSYTEEVLIKNKLKVAFTTRSAANVADITRELDSKKFNLMSSMVEQKALLNICYSLVAYNGKGLKDAPIDIKKAFIEKLPAVVIMALSNALVEFDLKTEAALGESEAF